MQRLISLAAAATVATIVASPVAAQWIVQPAIGVNFAKISNGDEALSDPDQGITAKSKTRTGFAAGVGILYAVSPQFSIGTGGYYSQQGVKATLTDQTTQTQGDGTLEIDYIQVPLTAGVSFATGGSITPHLFAGPMLGFNVTCKLSGGGTSVDCPSDTVESIDFGLLFGGGLSFRAGTGAFVVDAYYDLGLSNIAKDAASGSPTFKNQVFGVSVGYGFPLGGGM